MVAKTLEFFFDYISPTSFIARVPVQQVMSELAADLAVTLVHKGTIYDAIPVDFSLTGMLVKCAGLQARLRSKVVARVILEDFLTKVEAEVVRVDGNLVALHFVGAMRGGELNPPPQLGAIFSRLQQTYLKHRDK